MIDNHDEPSGTGTGTTSRGFLIRNGLAPRFLIGLSFLSVSLPLVCFFWWTNLWNGGAGVTLKTGEQLHLGAPRPEINVTLCLFHNTGGGFGNKLAGLVGYLALARATNRTVAVTGPSSIWTPFWQSDFPYYSDSSCNQNISIRCNTTSLKNHSSACSNALYESPEAVVQIELETSLGDALSAATSHPLFRPLYAEKVLEQYPNVPISWLNRSSNMKKEIFFPLEIPRVLHTPTKKFAAVINNFEKQHNLSSSGSGDYVFDLGIQVRQCVDCGWLMTRDQIRANMMCSIEEFGGYDKLLPEGSKVFVASDSRNNLDLIFDLIPPGVTVIENIPKTFIHTTKAKTFEELAIPYLHSYLLGRSRLIASCATSFPFCSAFRVGGPTRLRDIVFWEHHPPEHNPNATTFRDKKCYSLESTMPLP